MKKLSHLDKYAALFHEKMKQTDPLLQAVLTGHLIIETALDNILAVVFFHPEHLFKEARLSFSQKAHVVRAYGLRKNDNSMWDIILTVNSVRNEIAHNLAGEGRNARLQQLRSLFRAEASGEMQAMLEQDWGELKDVPDPVIVVWACSLCTGFLGEFEADVSSLRNTIDALDDSMNPDRERVTRKTPEEAKAKAKKPGKGDA
ncbi:hypothetical protein [Pelagibacterium sp.]|uniref:hypothetical protein n=1 Tax=Pelagibacterium sp. TaxID=1967288 RepID=UPI003A95663F